MRKGLGWSIGVCLVMFFGLTGALAQRVPSLINYQGRLMDGAGAPVEGATVDLTFTFYGSSVGGAAYLTVRQDDVMVRQGVYQVLIGSGTIIAGLEDSLPAVFSHHSVVWMGVKVGSDPEMSPRSRIASVPYALTAGGLDLASVYAAAVNDPDHDGDGFTSPLVGGDDCNELDSKVHPGATEFCDGVDNQCPGDGGYGVIDEGCLSCEDGDGDGYGAGCPPGPDCDDDDPNNWAACAACVDSDLDGDYAGCDAYVTITGPDCDDQDPNNWASCSTCQDADQDRHYLGCDLYLTLDGPDCDDADLNAWDTCGVCTDGDGDGYFTGCNNYYGIEEESPACDASVNRNPGLQEIPGNTTDENCDGNLDYKRIRWTEDGRLEIPEDLFVDGCSPGPCPGSTLYVFSWALGGTDNLIPTTAHGLPTQPFTTIDPFRYQFCNANSVDESNCNHHLLPVMMEGATIHYVWTDQNHPDLFHDGGCTTIRVPSCDESLEPVRNQLMFQCLTKYRYGQGGPRLGNWLFGKDQDPAFDVCDLAAHDLIADIFGIQELAERTQTTQETIISVVRELNPPAKIMMVIPLVTLNVGFYNDQQPAHSDLFTPRCLVKDLAGNPVKVWDDSDYLWNYTDADCLDGSPGSVNALLDWFLPERRIDLYDGVAVDTLFGYSSTDHGAGGWFGYFNCKNWSGDTCIEFHNLDPNGNQIADEDPATINPTVQQAQYNLLNSLRVNYPGLKVFANGPTGMAGPALDGLDQFDAVVEGLYLEIELDKLQLGGGQGDYYYGQLLLAADKWTGDGSPPENYISIGGSPYYTATQLNLLRSLGLADALLNSTLEAVMDSDTTYGRALFATGTSLLLSRPDRSALVSFDHGPYAPGGDQTQRFADIFFGPTGGLPLQGYLGAVASDREEVVQDSRFWRRNFEHGAVLVNFAGTATDPYPLNPPMLRYRGPDRSVPTVVSSVTLPAYSAVILLNQP